MSDEQLLASWNDTPTRDAIVEFVGRVATAGPGFVPAEERLATFDNDGTLWCEKPMPIELGFILTRLAEMAEQDESLRSRQPWKAAYGNDYGWLSDVITKHYAGDDSDVKVLMGGILAAFAGATVDDYEKATGRFVREGEHPTLGRRFRDCAFAGRSGTGLALLVNHDDNDREFAYLAGAEQALEQAADNQWTVVSVRNDWSAVFADGQPS
jgi:hypothetical protein